MADRIETYLERLDKALMACGGSDARILEEVRGHLLDATDVGVARGLSRDDAEREAIAAFGQPSLVAEPLSTRLVTRFLAACCWCSLLALGYLSLSVAVLRPPQFDAAALLVKALLLSGQSVLTLLVVAYHAPAAWMRRALVAGGAVLFSIGLSSAYRAASRPHFEGYALVLGAWVMMQAVLTVWHVAIDDKFGSRRQHA